MTVDRPCELCGEPIDGKICKSCDDEAKEEEECERALDAIARAHEDDRSATQRGEA